MSAEPSNGVSRDVAVPIFRVLVELGLSPAEIVPAGAAIFAEPHIDHSIADMVLDHAAARLSDGALGLTLAERLPLGSLGVIDDVLSTSAVLRDGLNRLARYYWLASRRSKLSLVEDPRRATIVFERQPSVAYSRHSVELAFALVRERIRQTLGVSLGFDEVAFMHPPPADASRHNEFFRAQVTFAAPSDRLVFATSFLDMPLTTAAPSLAEFLEARIGLRVPDPDPTLARVRQAIAELLDRKEVALDAAARKLGKSRRTLQRELHERGTSHKEILDAVRRERALELLGSGALGVAQVADVLGFADPSAFYRAFRRWTGSSPKAFRSA
jgi:AraC-like DNA-binding protein